MVVAVLVAAVGQLGFWALLRAGVFMEALAGGALFWSLAFPSWIAAGRRWWRTSATPDVALALTLILMTAASFYASGGLSDGAYCSEPVKISESGIRAAVTVDPTLTQFGTTWTA